MELDYDGLGEVGGVVVGEDVELGYLIAVMGCREGDWHGATRGLKVIRRTRTHDQQVKDFEEEDNETFVSRD